eukprot:symbB.v1.2.031827.t1/scaffold3738.1/size51178/4
MAAKGPSANGVQRSAADILAAFRNRVDRQIAGEPDAGAKQESEDGTTFFLTTSAAVKRRKEVEETARARKDLEVLVRLKGSGGRTPSFHGLHELCPYEKTFMQCVTNANGRGRKRMAHEIEESPNRPPTALELLCEQIPPPEPKRRERGERDRDKAFGSIREEKTETREIPKMEKTHPKKARRKAKVTNVPSTLQFKYLKELLEKATGPIVSGHIDEACIAWLAFEKAEDAESLFNDFNGGEISGESIEVELLSDSEPLGGK